VYQEYCDEMARLALDVTEVLAAALGLRRGALRGFFDGGDSIMRLNHYPACRQPHLTLGTGPHRDPTSLTLLHQDDVGGLQVRDAAGGWIDVTPLPGAFVVNIGEMLEIATGGYLRATDHRVVSPAAGVDRYSIPFFLGPRLDAVVEPLRLPPDLAARARGVTQDPDNPLLAAFGEKALLGWLRSHPRVAERWWPDVLAARSEA